MKFNTFKQEEFILKKIVPYLVKKAKILKKIKKITSKSKSRKENDPVTSFDIKIQKDLTNMILKHFPDHQVDGEESSTQRRTRKFKWTLDPIDGTKSFIVGMPTYSNLIGFGIEKRDKIGFAFFPELEKYYITSDKNSFVANKGKKRERIFCSRQVNLEKSKLVFNTFQTIKNIKFFNYFKKYKNFLKFTGADAYNYCRLAEGKIDIIIESDLKPYDIKPLIPLIRNAGGKISDWLGNENIEKGNILVAANKILHKKMLSILKKLV